MIFLFAVFWVVPAWASPKITLNKTSKVLYAGADKLGYRRVSLKATLTDLSGKVRYKSSDPSVVTVNSAGRAYARKKGKADVTAYVKSGTKTYKAVCRITVKNPTLKFGVSSLTVKVGNTVSVPVTVIPKTDVKWSVYNGKKASVENGKVKGIKDGATYIYAEANGLKKKLKVTIEKAVVQENEETAYRSFLTKKGYVNDAAKSGIKPVRYEYAILDMDQDGTKELLIEGYLGLVARGTQSVALLYTYDKKQGKMIPVQFQRGNEWKAWQVVCNGMRYSEKYNCLVFQDVFATYLDGSLCFKKLDGAKVRDYKTWVFTRRSISANWTYTCNGAAATESEYQLYSSSVNSITLQSVS